MKGRNEDVQNGDLISAGRWHLLADWVAAAQVIVHALLLGEVDKEWSYVTANLHNFQNVGFFQKTSSK